MLTLFTTLRPFTDPHIATIQRNAIRSWLALDPTPQVILIGNEPGVPEIAAEFSLSHIPQVECDRRGIPLRSSLCQLARDAAHYDRLCIINGDIIILDGFYEALNAISLPQFIAAGQRYNLPVTTEIDFAAPDWRDRLRAQIKQSGELFIPSAIDYAVYPKSINPPILPPFSVTAPGWDPWFLFQHQQRGIPVVNIGPRVTVIHQNHETPRQTARKQNAWRRDDTAMATLRQAGGFSSMISLREADYIVTAAGLQRPPWANRLLSRLSRNRAWRGALGFRRQLKMRYLSGAGRVG